MASLKTELDNLVLDQFKSVPAYLNKVNNVLDNDVVNKTAYDKFHIKVNTYDIRIPSTSGLVRKTQYDSEKQDLEKKNGNSIPNTSGVVKNTYRRTENREIENKIPSVTSSVTTAALNIKETEIASKIPVLLIYKLKLLWIQNLQNLKVKYIPYITNLPVNFALNTKATKIENKIPDTAAFNSTPEIKNKF